MKGNRHLKSPRSFTDRRALAPAVRVFLPWRTVLTSAQTPRAVHKVPSGQSLLVPSLAHSLSHSSEFRPCPCLGLRSPLAAQG